MKNFRSHTLLLTTRQRKHPEEAKSPHFEWLTLYASIKYEKNRERRLVKWTKQQTFVYRYSLFSIGRRVNEIIKKKANADYCLLSASGANIWKERENKRIDLHTLDYGTFTHHGMERGETHDLHARRLQLPACGYVFSNVSKSSGTRKIKGCPLHLVSCLCEAIQLEER